MFVSMNTSTIYTAHTDTIKTGRPQTSYINRFGSQSGLNYIRFLHVCAQINSSTVEKHEFTTKCKVLKRGKTNVWKHKTEKDLRQH